MPSISHIFIVVIFSIFSNCIATASTEIQGSIAGNSADRLVNENVIAGFLGKDNVTWCVDYDKDFGIDKTVAEQQIEEGLQQWKKYLIGKDVNFFPAHLKHFPVVELNTQKQKACAPNPDITFYLGSLNDELKERHIRFNNPLSFSKVQDYSAETGKGRSYVWIQNGSNRPNWNYLPYFRAVILHEIGHLLGCGHVEGTIMRADLADAIGTSPKFDAQGKIIGKEEWDEKRRENYAAAAQVMFTNIDYSQELYFGPSTGISLSNYVEIGRDEGDTDALKNLFRDVLAVDLKGKWILQKFFQFRGLDKSGRVIGSLFLQGVEEIEASNAIADLSGDSVSRLDFIFDSVKPEGLQLLSRMPIFRRIFGKTELKLYSPSAVRSGNLIGVRVNGKLRDVNMKVKYYRNIGKFHQVANWDKTLAKLTRILDDGGESILFHAPFDRQGFKADGFYDLPGGTPYR